MIHISISSILNDDSIKTPSCENSDLNILKTKLLSNIYLIR
jgi:hypothetical protein